jgi:hypothetical protein
MQLRASERVRLPVDVWVCACVFHDDAGFKIEVRQFARFLQSAAWFSWWAQVCVRVCEGREAGTVCICGCIRLHQLTQCLEAPREVLRPPAPDDIRTPVPSCMYLCVCVYNVR